MIVGRQRRIQAAAVLFVLLSTLLTMRDGEVIPVILAGTTVDVFQMAGALLAGFLIGYILFAALRSEDE